MHVSHQFAFKEILDDFSFILQKQPHSLVWKYTEEPNALETDLSFQPVISDEIINHLYQKDACTLCERRISYKNRQFEEKIPEIPLLILIHNTFLGEYERTYHDPEIEREFNRLLQEGCGQNSSQFLIREALKCHFGAEDIQNEEWIQNCQSHIQKDILRCSIKGILIMGEAAPLIFKEKAELSRRMNETSEFMGLPTIVAYGPSRIVYMKKKKYPMEKIKEAKEDIKQKIHIFCELLSE